MSVDDFQQQVLSKLSAIEAKQEMFNDTQKEHTMSIKEIQKQAIEAIQSAKSAHHRIDGIRKDATIIASLVGFFVTIVAKILIK